jgi:hypothetical protein
MPGGLLFQFNKKNHDKEELFYWKVADASVERLPGAVTGLYDNPPGKGATLGPGFQTFI